MTPAHLVQGGIQINTYFINVKSILSVRTTRHEEYYQARPFEGAVYLQDKMEFEGMIANIGVRLDLWYSGMKYYQYLFEPFGKHDSLGRFNPNLGTRQKSPFHVRLQSRLGVSFPISSNTVFH